MNVNGVLSRLARGLGSMTARWSMAVAAMVAVPVAVNAQVVISQVYGGGNNSGAIYQQDFVELFNRGATAVNISGWSVQYASAAGTTWSVATLPSVSIPAGRYFLVQMTNTASPTNGIALPTPDRSPTTPASMPTYSSLDMSATAGKVALVNNAIALTGGFPSGPTIVDFVGFGTTANWYEGSGPTTAPANGTALFREFNGCGDTDNNATDFVASATQNARNSTTPANTCALQAQLSTTRVDCSSTAPTVDGTISAGEYGPGNAYSYTGGGTGFGGNIGGGTLYMKSSATDLYVALAPGGGGLGGNYAVVYLNTVNGGQTDQSMNDTGDAGRMVVTRLTTGSGNYANNPLDAFPFAADLAILFTDSSATVFGLTTGSLTLPAGTTSAGGAGGVREVKIPFTSLGTGFVAGRGVDFFTAFCSSTNFNSNETIPPTPTLNAGANPGFGPTGATYDRFSRFVTFVSSTPTISTQPVAQTVCVGNPVTFSVQVNGFGPISYQWRKGGVNIPGATSNTYTIASTVAGDAANYDVVATLGCTTLTSSAVALTVSTSSLPVITLQPSNSVQCAAQTTTFSVATSATSPTYQWQLSTDGGLNWANATAGSGLTSATMTTTAAALNNSQFRCKVTSGSCFTFSNAATLTVNAGSPPAAPTGTASYTVTAGSAPFLISVTPPSGSTTDWFTVSCGGTLVSGGFGVNSITINPTTQGSTTYFARSRDTAGGCVSLTCLSVVVNVTPVNDTCAGAIALSLDTPVAGSTAGATNDYLVSTLNPPFSGVGQTSNSGAGRDVVYSFTPPVTGSYSVRVWRNVSFNPVIYLVAGPCPTGTAPITVLATVAANRNTSSTTNSSADELYNVTLTGGTLYYIFVDESVSTGGGFIIEVNTCNNEVEANGTPATATSYVFGTSGMEGSISTAGDVDFFSLGTPASGSRVFAMADGLSGSSNDFDMRVTTTTDTLEYDDSDGDTQYGSLAPVIAGTPTTGVATFIRMNHFSASTISEPYRLYAVVQPPSAQATAENEPNDTIATATYGANNYFSGTLSSAADVDTFGFTASAGQLIFAALDCAPARGATAFDGVLTLMDSAGNTIVSVNGSSTTANTTTSGAGNLAASNPNFGSEGLAWRAMTSGTYYVKVTSTVSTNLPGAYLVSVALSTPTYCTPSSTLCTVTDPFISTVSVNTINNSSTSGAGCYQDFTSQNTSMQRGVPYTINVGVTNDPGSLTVTAWVDWNNNGVFTDSGEQFTLSGGAGIYTGSITLPNGTLPAPLANLGNARMRVRVQPVGTPASCGSQASGETEDYTIFVTPAPAPPSNDACASALALTLNGSVNGTTALATNDGSSSCDTGGGTSRDVWYTVTIPAGGGLASLNTCSAAAIDTVISLYSGTCGALTEVACNDNCGGSPCGGTRSCLSGVVAAGTYYVRVSDKGGTSGTFTLTNTFIAAPTNGTCATAASLTASASATVTGTADTTADAGLDAAMPALTCGVTASRDVFWTVTIPASPTGTNNWIFETCSNTASDTVVQVFDVCGLGAVSLGCSDDFAGCGNGLQSRVSVALAASAVVKVRVATKGNGGSVTLGVRPQPPANDDCSGAIALAPTGTPGTAGSYGVTGVSLASPVAIDAATADDQINPVTETAPAVGSGTASMTSSRKGVWYTVIGTGTTMTASTCGSSITDTQLIVMCGDCSGLTRVIGNDDSGPACAANTASASWCATAGATYYIWIAPFSATTGTITLKITDDSVSCTPTITCPSCTPTAQVGTTPVSEVEACSAATPGSNNGCDLAPNGFQDVSLGAGAITVLGSTRAFGGTPAYVDSDWYRFQAPSSNSFAANVTAQFPVKIELRQLAGDGSCTTNTLIGTTVTAGRCATASLSANLTLGTWYALKVMPNVASGFACSATSTNYAAAMGMGVPTPPTCSPSASPATVDNSGTVTGATTFTVIVTQGTNPPSTAHTVTANLTAVGGGAAVPMVEGPTNTFTLAYTVPGGTASGSKTITFTTTETAPQSRSSTCSTTLTVNPANDVCGVNQALFTIPGTGGSVSGNLAFANSEGNAASSCQSGTGQKDLFYYFTPATGCGWTFSTCGGTPDVDTIISIHTACPTPSANNQVLSPTSLCADQGCSSGNLSLLTVPAGTLTPGTQYVIRVAMWSSTATPNAFAMNVTPTGPANDLCANATALTVTSGAATATGDNSCATAILDPAVSPPSCMPAASRDMWYTFTTGAAQGGPWLINTCGSAIDTVLTLYTGATCATAVEAACNDDALSGSSCLGLQSEIQTVLLPSTTYRVRVSAGLADPAGGAFTLNVIYASPPSSDDCAAATVIAATGGTASASNQFATTDGPRGTQVCTPDISVERDVWFSFSPTATGNWRFSTCGSSFDTVMELWSDCEFNGGVVLACNDDGGTCGTGSQFDMYNLAAGSYRVRVMSKVGGGAGAFTLTISTAPPQNDTCATATLVSENSLTQGTTVAATVDTVPACTGLILPASNTINTSPLGVWYTVVSSSNQTLTADTITSPLSGTAIDSDVIVYSGTCGSLTCVIANDDIGGTNSLRSKVSWVATQGTTYYILVTPDGTTTGTFALAVSASPTPANDSCSTPIALTPNSGTINGTTIGATGMDGIGLTTSSGLLSTTGCTTTNGFFDVWYAYTPTCSGTATFATCGTYDTVLSVHSACPTNSASNLIASFCNNDGPTGCTPGSQVSSVPVTAGTTYLIRVAGALGYAAGSPFTLTWAGPVDPPTAPSSAGADFTSICSVGGPATINLSAVGGSGTTLAWYAGGCGAGASIGSGASLAIAAPAVTTTYYARWENTCGNSTCASVTVNVVPAPTANAGSGSTICATGAASLNGSGTNATGFAWTGGTGTFLDASNPVTTYTPGVGESGAVVLTLTATGNAPCANSSSNVTINVVPSPTVNAGSGSQICSNTSASLNGSGTNAASYLWTGGTGTFANATSPTTTYTPGNGETGIVVLTLTANGNSPCGSVSSNVTIDIVPAPTANAGSSVFICSNGFANLLGSASNYTSLQWSGGLGVFGSPNSLATTYTPGLGEIGLINLTLTATGSSPCAVAQDTVLVIIVPAPTVNAGTGGNVCSNGSFNLSGSATNHTTLTWSGGTGVFGNPNSLTTTYTPGAGESGPVVLTLTAGGTAPCSSVISNVTVNVVPAPTVNAGSSSSACSNGSASLNGSGTNAVSYSWSGGTGSFADATNPVTTYTPGVGESGAVVLTLTATGNSPCASASSNVTINVVPAPTVNAGTGSSVCSNGSAGLNGSGTNAASYLWTGGTGTFADATSPVTTYSPGAGESGPVVLTLTATGNAPCASVSGNVTINVVPAPTVNAGAGSTVCANASASLNGSGTNAASYLWTGGTGTFGNASSAVTTYTPGTGESGPVVLTLTATGNAPCASTSSNVTITVEPVTAISTQPLSLAVCFGSPANFTVGATGAGLTYQWRLNGNPVLGATSATYSIAAATPLDAGAYDCVVTGTCGSATSSPATLVVGAATVTTVYVDDDYAPLSNGTLVNFPYDGMPGPYIVGCNAFGGIQAGHNAVVAGGTVNVAAGTYRENITVTKAVSIVGPNAMVAGCGGRAPEAVLQPSAGSAALDGILIYVTASNVSVSGMYLDGDNPANPFGEMVGTANADVANIISNGSFDNDMLYPFVPVKNITISNNVVRSSNDILINLYNDGAAPVSDNNVITGNCIQNQVGLNTISVGGPYSRIALLMYNDTYAQVDNNTFDQVRIGVQTGNNYRANGGPAASISGNAITSERVGIWHNLHYADSSPWTISNNTVSTVVGAPNNEAIFLSSLQSAVSVTVSGNTISGAQTGYSLWNLPTSSTVTVSGGSVTGCAYGVYATNNDSSFGQGADTRCVLDGVAISGSTGAGVWVDDSETTLIGVSITNNCQVTGGLVGVRASGGDARALVQGSTVTGASLAALQVSGGAKLDAGDCSASNFTGLGSSTGGNVLTGYGFDSAAPWAVLNQNTSAEPNVLAQNDSYGESAGQDIGLLISGNGGANSAVLYTSATGPSFASNPTGGTICEGGSITLSAGAANFSTYQWRHNGNPIMGATAASYTINNATPADAGSYDLVATDACSATATSLAATVNVTPASTASAGSGSTICSTGSASLTGSGSNAASFAWTGGTGTFADATNPVTTYTPGVGETGNVTLTLTATGNAPCGTAVSTVTITIVPAATVNAGTGSNVCSNGSTSLNGSGSNAASFAWSGGTGTFGNASSPTTTYAPGVGESGPVLLTLTAFGNSPCGNAISSVTINVVPAPTVNAGSGSAICSTGSAGLSGSGTNAASYLWTGGTGMFADATNPVTTYTPGVGESGAVVLTLTATGNAPCASASSNVTINVTPAPTAVAGAAQTICANGSASLAGSVTNAAGSLWSSSGDGVFANAGSPATTYTPGANDITNGTATLTLTATGNAPCGNASSNLVVTIQAVPAIGTQPTSQVACLGQSATFTIVASGVGPTYQWRLNGAPISGATSASYTIFAVAAGDVGTYDCVVTDACGTITSSPATLSLTPAPAVTYVDDGYVGLPIGTTVNWPDNGNPGPHTIGCDAFATIQGGVDRVLASGTVNVAAGSYGEDVLVSKTVAVLGAGPGQSIVTGPAGGQSQTFLLSASNITLSGFTITRFNYPAALWSTGDGGPAGPQANTANIGIAQGTTGILIKDNLITQGRTGIDINNSGGHTVRNNVITDNRTGMILRNTTDNLTVVENSITNNWTIGVLFLDGSVNTNVPVQSAANSVFANNDLSGNWYGQIEDRQANTNLPLPGTNLKNFSGNWLGTTSPVISAASAGEPGYTALIPASLGGSSVPPGGQPDIKGAASANFDYTPMLASGTDTNSGAYMPDIYAFQGDYSSLVVASQLAQSGTTGRIQEAHDLVSVGGGVSVQTGAYSDNVVISKRLTITGAGGGTCTGSADPLTQTVVVAANPAAPVFTISNAGGSSALARLTLASMRVTGTAGGVSGVLVTAPFGSSHSYFAFQSMTVAGNGGPGINFSGAGASFADAVIDSSNLCGNYQGLVTDSNLAAMSSVSVSGSQVRNNTFHGLAFFGSTPDSYSPTGIAVSNTQLSNNGQSNNLFQGSGDLAFFEVNGNVSLTNVTVNTVGRRAISFVGRGGASPANWLPAGTVTLNGVSVSGTADRAGLSFQHYADVSGVMLSNVDLSGMFSLAAPFSGFATVGMELEHFGAVPLPLNNTIFPCQGGQSAGYVGLSMLAPGGATASCSTVFVGAGTVAQKEACVFDQGDYGAVGDVTFADVLVTVDPSNSTVCEGLPASFSVAATGEAPITYQWRHNGVPIGGATNATYNIAAAAIVNGGTYDCVVTNACGSATSGSATLTVNANTAITTPPASTSACVGNPATFTVAASGNGLLFQWRFNGSPIFGATASSFTIPSVSPASGGTYDVIVAGTCGLVTSTGATLTVNTVPSISSGPTSTSACVGSPAVFSVLATGTAPFTYQWRKNGVPIGGQINPVLLFAAVAPGDAASYDCEVTNICGTTTSPSATLTVNVAPSVTGQPASTSSCLSGSVTFSVTATGTAPLSYQWRKNGNPIGGATSASYNIASVAATDAANYDCVVTNACGADTSSAASLIVLADVAILINPSPSTVCPGQPATFTVSATGAGPLTYQWRKNGNPIGGAVNATYTIASVSAGDAGNYDCVVSGACAPATSTAAALTVNTTVIVGPLPPTLVTCLGSPATFTASASGTGPLAYQWQKNGFDIGGATSPSYTIPSVANGDAGNYTCVVTGACGSVTSTATQLVPTTVPQFTLQPVDTSAGVGGVLTLSVAVSSPLPVTYQWRLNNNPLANVGPVSGANSPVLVISPVGFIHSGAYDVLVTNSCGTATSVKANVTIGTPPIITLNPLNTNPRLLDCVTLNAAAIGGPSLSYQWYFNGNPISDGGSYSGATTTSLTICPVQAIHAGSYTMVATSIFGSATTTAGVLTINPSCNCADIVAIGGVPPPDGLLTGDDFISFINAFANNDPLADIASIGGLCGPDGLITGDDFVTFTNSFSAGCP